MTSIQFGTYTPVAEDPVEESTTQAPVVIFFFRSEEQAKGYPKPGNIDSEKDNLYVKDFGFDIYRPSIYKSTFNIVTDSYEKYDRLPITVKDSKNASFQIDEHFNLLSSGTGIKAYSEKYYFPNIMIMPSRSVTIYAKLFTAEPMTEPLTLQISLDKTAGIKNCPKEIIFPQTAIDISSGNFPVIPIIIETGDEEIEEDIILTVTRKESVINKPVAKCVICKNKVYSPRVCFVDVVYDESPEEPLPDPKSPLKFSYKPLEVPSAIIPPRIGEAEEVKKPAVTSTMDATALCSEINKQGMNQAGIHIVTGNRKRRMTIRPKHYLPHCPLVPMGGSGMKVFARSLVDAANGSFKNIEGFLHLADYKFFEPYAKELLSEIEKSYKKVNVPVFNYKNNKKYTVPLMKETESFEEVMKKEGESFEYEDALSAFCYFLKYSRFNIFPVFSSSFTPNASDGIMGLGYVPGKGVMLSSEITDMMDVIHELGHNFGLGHTFRVPLPVVLGEVKRVEQPADITLPVKASRENIMDYCSYKNSFISFQWKKMRALATQLTPDPEDFDFTTTKENDGFYLFNDSPNNYLNRDGLCLSLNIFSKLLSKEYIRKKENILTQVNDNNRIKIEVDKFTEVLFMQLVNIWIEEIKKILNKLNTI
ncbi:MAG: hypothetical protein ACK5KL_05285 [Dysgonomonas sp.]